MNPLPSNIRELADFFKKNLLGLYESNEVESLFSIVFEHEFGIKPFQVRVNPGKKVTAKEVNEIIRIIEELKRYKPVQYITGKMEFYNTKIRVNPSVLIPRPETEELVQWIINECYSNQLLNILDIGTGSGCIAIALAKNLKNAKVEACDISGEALELAANNARENEVNIRFYKMDILTDLGKNRPFSYDIIVSNPPYVTESEKRHMNKNVLDYEPVQAIFVQDEDPLLFYEAIAEFGQRYLENEGHLFLEINEAFGTMTRDLLKDNGYTDIELKKDIHLKNRMIHARKR